MVRLTNPQGKEMILEEKAYKELLFKFAESSSFQEWANKNNLVGIFTHNGKKTVNRMVFQVFFDQKGYKLEKNIEIKKDGRD